MTYDPQGAKWLSEMWNDDWQHFFKDVEEQTGLGRQDAMLFHLVTSTLFMRHALDYLAGCQQADRSAPKEPWQQP